MKISFWKTFLFVPFWGLVKYSMYYFNLSCCCCCCCLKCTGFQLVLFTLHLLIHSCSILYFSLFRLYFSPLLDWAHVHIFNYWIKYLVFFFDFLFHSESSHKHKFLNFFNFVFFGWKHLFNHFYHVIMFTIFANFIDRFNCQIFQLDGIIWFILFCK